MNILESIIANKRAEILERRSLYPVKLLERSVYFNTQPISLKQYIHCEEKCGVIAEIKRKSPSKGIFNNSVDVEKLSIGYMQAGASALSVLTDKQFFGGSNEDLTIARKFNYCPILRKEFIISEYQILEARAIGADAILLIASILSQQEIRVFTDLAHSLRMEVLFEIHSQQELLALETDVDIIGINNRNLSSNDFATDVHHSIALAELIPNTVTKISASGISKPEIAAQLKKEGYDGFLIGEHFMRNSRPEEACKMFIDQLKKLSNAN